MSSVSASTWTNTVGGAWAEPRNWSDHLVPTGGDVTIGLPGTFVVTLNEDTTVGRFLFDNPTATLSGAGTLSVSEAFTWTRGILGGPATAALVADRGLLLTGSGVGGRRVLSRMLINAGQGTWDDAATLALGQGVVISNLVDATFLISGDGHLDSGGGNAYFSNAGLLHKTGSGATEFGAEFRNSGVVRIEAGTLNLRQGIRHSGSIEISNLAGLNLAAGTHDFAAGSSLTGGGELTIRGGSANLGGTVALTGRHRFLGGNVAVTGTYLAIGNTLTVDGANVAFSGGYRCISNQLEVVSGTMRFDGVGTLEPSGLAVGRSGRLEGTTPVVVRGPILLQSATLGGGGTLIAGAGLTLQDGGFSLSGRTLVNGGPGRWTGTGGSLAMGDGAVITNLQGATFDLELDATVANTGGAGGFVNEGVFRKTGGAGTSVFTTPFANRGTFETRVGTLSLSGGGIHRGNFQIGSGTRLNLGGTHGFAADSEVSGPGTLSVFLGTTTFEGLVDVSGQHLFAGGIAHLTGRYNAISNLVAITGGVANFSGTGTVTPASLVITNQGVLGGSGLVTVRGPMRWSAGRIQGSGSVVADGGLEMTGGALTLSGRALVNRGAGRWTGTGGSLAMGDGAVITNLQGATFDVELDTTVANTGGAGGFVNEGVFRKTGGAGTSVFTTAFRNSGRMELLAGTIRVSGGFTQTTGTLQLRGGSLSGTTPIRILGGRMLGSGTVFGTITNAGWIQPGDGPGRMIVDGDYLQDGAGSCEVRLAGYLPGTHHDQLVISNSVSLGGILVADLAEGFEPVPAAAFEIMKCVRRMGTFDVFRFPSNRVGMALEYSISNVTIRVVNTPPTLDPIPDTSLDESGSLALAVTARDADAPAQTLRFALTEAPAYATIDDRGVIRWRAVGTTPGWTTHITVVVTDDGTPNLSASRTFQVRVGSSGEPTAVALRFGVPATGSNTLVFRGIPGETYHAEFSLQVSGPWFDLASATAAKDGSWTVVDPSATNTFRFYRARSIGPSLLSSDGDRPLRVPLPRSRDSGGFGGR